ncbi:hypothetical protein VZT92_027740 [Zoarces viviparus]|uniref:Uncharacterized protein n=1 Tax=Zoarces viviparus TaxID=48416 RepID=A0AAW1DVG1_ZOAVI
MKFSIIAALVVVLAVAHGTEAGSLVKRDAQINLSQMTKLIKDMSASITSATQDMVDKVKALEMTNTAQTYAENSRSQIQPLVEKVKPLTDNFYSQVKPLTSIMEKFFQQVMDSTKTLPAPQ